MALDVPYSIFSLILVVTAPIHIVFRILARNRHAFGSFSCVYVLLLLRDTEIRSVLLLKLKLRLLLIVCVGLVNRLHMLLKV